MDVANSLPDPGALEGARRATGDARPIGGPSKVTDSEVVPLARRPHLSKNGQVALRASCDFNMLGTKLAIPVRIHRYMGSRCVLSCQYMPTLK